MLLITLIILYLFDFVVFFVYEQIIVLFEGVNQLVGIITGGVLDAKAVIKESELDRMCVMLP